MRLSWQEIEVTQKIYTTHLSTCHTTGFFYDLHIYMTLSSTPELDTQNLQDNYLPNQMPDEHFTHDPNHQVIDFKSKKM